MKNTITIAADDFGLTRGITDTILEVVDEGPVQIVSILANGEAVAYALDEYRKRDSSLTLAVHLTLTEGRALSAPQDIPHLVDARGMFKHSIAGLWGAYLFASNKTRIALRHEVHAEIEAQCAIIRTALGVDEISVNGHEHVHMIPFVFEELMTIKGVSAVRIVRENFFFCGTPSLRNVLARFVLAMLSTRATQSANAHGIRTNDWFVGFLYSGHMDQKIAQAGIAHTGRGSLEVLFHPGSALSGELSQWREGRAGIAWHYAPERQIERETLKKIHLNGQKDEMTFL